MADLRQAVEKLDNREFKGQAVHCVSDPQEERPRDRFRSRSPGPRTGGRYPPGPPDDFYDRRGARGYSPRRDDYRRRSPPPRDYYGRGDDRYGRPPSRGPPRRDDYGPPRRYDDPYAPPPRGAPYEDPYVNGHGAHGRPYAGGPPSPRRRSPGRAPVYDGGYDGARPPRY